LSDECMFSSRLELMRPGSERTVLNELTTERSQLVYKAVEASEFPGSSHAEDCLSTTTQLRMGSRLRRCSTRIRLCLRLIVAGKMVLWRELSDLRQQKLRCLLPSFVIRDLEVTA
jgi:hypothetical protein